jgi:hypothetical protein
VVLVATLVLLFDYYHPLLLGIGPELSLGVGRIGLFLIVPLATLLLLGERPPTTGCGSASGAAGWRSWWSWQRW